MLSNHTSPYSFRISEFWSEIFGNTKAVEVEIGSGTGIFLLAAAASRPDTNFLAIEKSKSRAYALAEVVRKRALNNAIVLHADATCVVESMLPPQSVQAFHIYFPDPWWKRRHERRRIFTPEFVDAIASALRSGGYVYVATDVDSVFTLMRESLRACASLREDSSKPSPRLTITTFERKGLSRGATIRQSAFVRTVGQESDLKSQI